MLKFGMIGCGSFIEAAVLPMMLKTKNARPAAAFDPNRQTRERVCRKFGIKKACSTFEEMLKLDEVDAIYIASPNYLHKSQAIAAAKAKKHVFCQKPIALNTAEARKMLEACRKNRVKLGIGFCYRFGGAQQLARKLIREGTIGKVSYIHLSFNLPGYNPKTVGWRCNPKLSGGGPLMDIAPHLIDLAAFLMDDRAESVMAYVRPEMTAKEIETDALAIMQFKSGARAAIDTSFVRGNTHNYTIVGTKGQIHAMDTMRWLAGCGELRLQVEGKEQKIPFPKHQHIAAELRLFCAAVENNRQPPVPGEAGLDAQAVIDAIYQSGRTGKCCPVRY